MDELELPTSDSTALSPAVGGDLSPVSTLADDNGVAQVAANALSQATTGAITDPVETTLAAVPDSDDDLSTITDEQQRTTLTGMRGQLRVLRDAVRGYKPLEVFREFGSPEAVKPRLELAKLLYSPKLDARGQPIRDPATQTTYVTTTPFIAHLDKVSPGMPEQLYVDLNYYTPLGEDGVSRTEALWKQHFRYLKLNPDRLAEYQNLDALIARSSDVITPEELAEIPADRHAAYRSIPPSIRSAWASYEPADQTRMLDDYQRSIDSAARDAKTAEDDKRREAEDSQKYAATVFTNQQKYFDTIRRERFTQLYTDLEQQVTFSPDAATNGTMLGALCATLSNLLDPQWRFIAVEKVLTPLGLRLPPGFDEVLGKFESNAMEKVATEMAGDIGRAGDHQTHALNAVEQMMAKIAPIALAIAKKQGATVVEKAATQAAALAAAATGRVTVAATTAPTRKGILPDGMNPDSWEATQFLARQTGLLGNRPAA